MDGDPEVKASFERTMSVSPDAANGQTYTPLDRFVMELFRVISPNAGGLSTLAAAPNADPQRQGYIFTPHPANSRDSRHWTDPDAFNPDRYLSVPTSADIDEEHCKEIGLARCPFSQSTKPPKDGRDGQIANSGFGTVHPVVGGTAYPVVDHAGHAPFGFGYRRCAGEWLTVDLFKDVLRKIHRDGISFERLALDSPEKLPVGPLCSSRTTSGSPEPEKNSVTPTLRSSPELADADGAARIVAPAPANRHLGTRTTPPLFPFHQRGVSGMSTSKHPKGAKPPRDDLETDPGIGRSKGRFSKTNAPPLEGENTYEGDVGNDATPQGGVDPKQRGRENK